jgi:hypothetical protein
MTGAPLSRPLLRIRVPVNRLLLHRSISCTPPAAGPSSASNENLSNPSPDDHLRKLQWQLESGPKPSLTAILLDSQRPTDYVSKYVRSVTQQHNWGFPRDVRRVSLKGLGDNPCSIALSVSHRHCIDSQAMTWLARDPHPIVQSILDRHIADEDKPLWFYPRVSNPNGAISPFAINTTRRRIKRCVRLALEECGYDIHGRSLRPVREGAEPRHLFGTMRVFVSEALKLCQMSDADILSFTRPMVDIAVLEFTLGANRNRDSRKEPQQKISRVPEKRNRDPELVAKKSRQQRYKQPGNGRFNEKGPDRFDQHRDNQETRTGSRRQPEMAERKRSTQTQKKEADPMATRSNQSWTHLRRSSRKTSSDQW